jgi:hypothetical protein
MADLSDTNSFDFKDRYAADAGMPDYLRAAAARNLAAQDAAIGNVNAVSRAADPWTGYGQISQYVEPGTVAKTTYGLGPEYTGTNNYSAGTVTGFVPAVPTVSTTSGPTAEDYGIADAMDASQEFGRGISPDTSPNEIPDDHPLQIPLQRAALISQGIDPDQPAVWPSRTRPAHGGPSRWETLQNEAQSTYKLNASNAIADARLAHERLGSQAHAQAAVDFSDFAKGLEDLKKTGAQYGSPQFESAFLGLLQNHPTGVNTSAGLDIVKNELSKHASVLKAQQQISGIQGLYTDPNQLLQDHPGAEYRQDPNTGRYYVYLAGRGDSAPANQAKNFEQKVQGLGLTPYDFQNSELWQRSPDDTKMFRTAENTGKNGGNTVTLNADTYNRLQAEHDALYRGSSVAAAATTTPPDITQDAYSKLKPGDTFYFKGKKLTKK